MAIASKLRDEQVVVIEELSFSEPKTRDMAAILKALGVSQLIVVISRIDLSNRDWLLIGNATHHAEVFGEICDLPCQLDVAPLELLLCWLLVLVLLQTLHRTIDC